MITLKRFRRLQRALDDAGHSDDLDWAEGLKPPTDAEQFARTAIYVVVNSGMSYRVAAAIFSRCVAALER